MRRLVPLLLLFALSAPVMWGDRPRSHHRPVLGLASRVTVTPIALDEFDPGRRRVGRLRFLGGWTLDHPDPAFGAFSAMAAAPESLLLVSDAGGVVRLALEDGAPSGDTRFADLAGPQSGALKRHRDSEALVVGRECAWVTFERENAVWRYSRDLSRPLAHAEPRAMARWQWRSGGEAITTLRDGRFIVFAEGGRASPPGTAQALIFDRDPTDPAAGTYLFYHRPPSGFSVTDAAALPDGRLLLLHRRIGVLPYLSAKLTLLDPRTIKPGEIASGEEIAHLAPPLAVDNMEALAIERSGDRTILWLASDDNFRAPLQRTLLLKFELTLKPPLRRAS